MTKAYSEPCQTFKVKRVAKIVNGWELFTIIAMRTILDVKQCSEYASA